MKRWIGTILIPTALLLAVLTVLAQTGGGGVDGIYAAQAAFPSVEYWRFGVTSEEGAAYGVMQGRLVHAAAAFRADRGTADAYFIFPAPSTQRTVRAARFCILSRTGAYRGSAALTLEILDYAGTVQHAASTVVELQAAPAGTWADVPLVDAPADLEIAPGEFLAFHFRLDGGPGGGLAVYPAFEVEVGRVGIFLPLVLRNWMP
jgi:hypothetical protein